MTIKYKKIKKKAQTVKRTSAINVTKGQGSVTYKLSGVDKAKFKKYFTVNSKTGTIKIKKKLKKGTYKVKVAVTAAGNGNYNKGTKTAVVTVKVS